MASFSSILSNIGHGLKVFFTGAEKVATIAKPWVDMIFPGIAPLFDSIVTEVGKAETAAIAAGAQNGTGAQKLALVVAALETDFNNYAAANGIAWDATKSEAIVNLVVQLLNTIPSGGTAAAVVGK